MKQFYSKKTTRKLRVTSTKRPWQMSTKAELNVMNAVFPNVKEINTHQKKDGQNGKKVD